jgi:ceramide glucosyltransferase
VVDGRGHGPNLKVGNLINMMAVCRHDIVVISDSDVLADPQALAAVVAPLAEERMGAVTCLYKGAATGGLASTLGALFINDWFLPSALVDFRLNGVDGCFGPLTAVRRSALAEAGGLEALVDYLADDNRLGRLLREKGWKLRLSRHLVHTMVGEDGLGALIRHELRWSRTVRACRPWDHVLSVVTFPLPLLLTLLALHPTPLGGFWLAVYGGLRLALHRAVRARAGLQAPPASWLLPLRELLCFLVWGLSLIGNHVYWRRREYRITAGGRLADLTP